MTDENKPGWFPSTAWSRIAAAKDPKHPRFKEAMTWLVTSYWRPVFCFLRARRHDPKAAEALTHEFFASFLIENWVEPADPSKGRFRGLLCTMVERFVIDQLHRPRSQTRFERTHLSLQELARDQDRGYEPPANETPDQAFHKAWKARTLERVRGNLKDYYEGLNAADELRRYHIFAAYHFADRVEEQPTQEALAAQFGVTRDQVRYALAEVEKRYVRFVRQELREETGSEEEVEEEIRDLLR